MAAVLVSRGEVEEEEVEVMSMNRGRGAVKAGGGEKSLLAG